MGSIKNTFLGGAEERAGEQEAAGARQASEIAGERFGEAQDLLSPFAQRGIDIGRSEIEQLKNASQLQLKLQKETFPLFKGGVSALQQQQALSGALGREAQAQAFQQFQESPGQAFLREQGLRGVSGQAAATGGLGSGARLRELTRVSQGFAQQDFANQFNRLGQVGQLGLQTGQQSLSNLFGVTQGLGNVTSRGLQAASDIGQLGQQSAGLQGSALQSAAESRAAGTLGKSQAQRQTIQQVAGGIGGFQTGGLTGALSGAFG